MTQEQIKKLLELKELYEAGILTKEEVEEEKKKILNTQQDEPVGEQLLPEQSSETQENKSDVVVEEDATPIMRYDESGVAFDQLKVKPKPETTNKTTPSSQAHNRAAFVGVFILIVIFFIIIVISMKCNGSNNDCDDQTYPDSLEESIVDIVDSTEYIEDPAFVEDEYETITSSDDGEFAYDPFSGNFRIFGGVYRLCESYAYLTINKGPDDIYTGTMELMMGSQETDLESFQPTGRFDDYNGHVSAIIRAKSSGNTLVIILDSYKVVNPGDYITDMMPAKGSQIFKISYDDDNYSVRPIGGMQDIFDGIGCSTTITR